MQKAVEDEPKTLQYVADHLKTKWMCKEAVRREAWSLYNVPDYFETQEMCDKAVEEDPCALEFVPDWFVIQEQLKIWHNDNYWHNSALIIKWYNGHKKQKAQKAKLKRELMPIAWHPSRWWDWCVPEDEKKETEKLWK